jgi:hypothetical protein
MVLNCLLRRKLSTNAVAAGECSYFVFMIPSSHSNPQEIRNREFETLLFLILLLFFFLLQAGESCGGLHSAGGQET